MARLKKKKSAKLYCSFCGKSQDEILKLIAGPASLICEECVCLCVTILIDEEIVTYEHEAYLNLPGLKVNLEGTFSDKNTDSKSNETPSTPCAPEVQSED